MRFTAALAGDWSVRRRVKVLQCTKVNGENYVKRYYIRPILSGGFRHS